MIRYHVCLPDDVKSQITHLHPSLKQRIRAALDLLEAEPRAGKPLEKELVGLWSYPVAPFRVVYFIEATRREVQIVRLGHRRGIYDLLAQRILHPLKGGAGEVRERPRKTYSVRSRGRKSLSPIFLSKLEQAIRKAAEGKLVSYKDLLGAPQPSLKSRRR